MSQNSLLVMLVTYNEARNLRDMVRRILDLDLPADVLIIDDNSPDGTGHIAEELARIHPCVLPMHRARKLGIGSAHLTGIRYAYEAGYKFLVTLDADFTHIPEYIPAFLESGITHDVVVGTRFQRKDSLLEWALFRKVMTHLSHFLTRTLVGLPYDATGAFRLYRLDHIDPGIFELVRGRDYEFFFESLTILHLNRYHIAQVPISLPARANGSSKMQVRHMLRGLLYLLRLAAVVRLAGQRLRHLPSGASVNVMRIPDQRLPSLHRKSSVR